MTRYAYQTKSLDPIEQDNHAGHVDVEDAIAALTTTTTAALTKQSAEVAQLADALGRLEAKAGRPGFRSDAANDNVKPTLDTEHKALGMFARSGDDSEFKSMQTQVDPSGGYVVLPAVSTSMTKRIWDQSPIRRLARNVTMESGDSFQEPLDKDESEAVWVGETQTRSATATPDLALLTIPLCEIWAQQPITQKLLDTSYINVGAWIEEKLSDKFARAEGVEFVSGADPLKPQGFMTLGKSLLGDMASRPATSLQFVVSGGATTVTADGLRDLFWSLRAGHRANATWLMASSTANAIDKLKNGTGDYVWRDSSVAGLPPTLLGKPVEFDENMPAIGAGTYPIALGDWPRGYVIIDRLGMRFARDPFTSKPHVLFDCFKRVGGGVSNTDAIKLLKISA